MTITLLFCSKVTVSVSISIDYHLNNAAQENIILLVPNWAYFLTMTYSYLVPNNAFFAISFLCKVCR